jgi:hypothetical protein
MKVQIHIDQKPAKLIGHPTMTDAQVQQQFSYAVQALVPVADNTPGTCGDERVRAGLLNGQTTVQARPSAWGGPNIQGLFMAELSGFFGDSELLSKERLMQITKLLNKSGIVSGGHKGCAANSSFKAVLKIIAKEGINWKRAAQAFLKADYQTAAADQVEAWANKAVNSGRYDDWDESILVDVLGKEAGQAIEILKDGPHTARTIVRVQLRGMTVSQNKLHELSGGVDSFVQDDPYCAKIESALLEASGQSERAIIMKHAREALLYAILKAVPNPELHSGQIA